MDKNTFFRSIPKVDALLAREDIIKLISAYGHTATVDAIRTAGDALRAFISQSSDEAAISARIEALPADIAATLENGAAPDLRHVINATGTILHTNLGRALISPAHAAHMQALVSGYSNLEYDLESGGRGERYSHFEDVLCGITGAEAAMAVNNNAAAVLLVLCALGGGHEIPVSRGELVEIGGKFRVPDVMQQSGVTMVEVGTTNKTHLSDYESAITEKTCALLKVHTSNYRIVGFTESVSVADLCALGERRGLPIIEDIGSGVLIDLSKYGLTYEPTVQDSIKAGVSVVCFSGDKLLGGPQAGIIVGKKQYIDKIKKHPLTRALRIDKFTAGALELTLRDYISEEYALKTIPVLRMITRACYELAEEAAAFKALLTGLDADVTIEDCESQIGGGSMPLERLPSKAVAIRPRSMSTAAFESALRALPTPVIVRVYDDKAAFDMRTIQPGEAELAAEGIKKILQRN